MNKSKKVTFGILVAISLFFIFGMGVVGIIRNIEAPGALETRVSLEGMADYSLDISHFKVSREYIKYYLEDGQDYPVVLVASLSENNPSNCYVIYKLHSVDLGEKNLVLVWDKSWSGLAGYCVFLPVGIGFLMFVIWVFFSKKKSKE